MIIAGALTVDPDDRAAYVEGCAAVVEAARRAPGCLDFALSADLVDPGRINVFERWVSEQALHRFRSSGLDGAQAATLLAIEVAEYTVREAPRG